MQGGKGSGVGGVEREWGCREGEGVEWDAGRE